MTSTIIDVSSPKGGVGKNITNANLGIGLANGGKSAAGGICADEKDDSGMSAFGLYPFW